MPMADEYVYKISSQYPQKWLSYDIKHVKNRDFSRDFSMIFLILFFDRF